MKNQYTTNEKARMVLEVLRGEYTLGEIEAQNNVHPTLLTRWKTQAKKNLSEVFENKAAKNRQHALEFEKEKDDLYKQIGKLTTQIELLKKNLVSNNTRNERVAMVESNLRGIPVSVQANLLGINRTSL